MIGPAYGHKESCQCSLCTGDTEPSEPEAFGDEEPADEDEEPADEDDYGD